MVRGLIPGKSRRDPTCSGFCRRVCCDVDPDEISAVQSNDDEVNAVCQTYRQGSLVRNAISPISAATLLWRIRGTDGSKLWRTDAECQISTGRFWPLLPLAHRIRPAK